MMKGYFHSKNHWALILGGSSGMGLASAKKLASEGMNICILHRDRRQQLPAIEVAFEWIRAQGVELLTYNIDALKVEKRDEVIRDLVEKLGADGKIRLLLHAIAKGNLKPMAAEDKQQPVLGAQDFALTIEAMATSLYDWVVCVREENLFCRDARIIGLTSEGSHRAWKSYAAVSAAKAALESLCRSMALEFAPFGLRSNIVQAGVTDTPSLRMIPGSEELIEGAIRRNPFKRLTRTEDIANAIFLLTREEAAWINGSLIRVDGGEGIVG